jgi:PiT family inorganic phosphate transporter
MGIITLALIASGQWHDLHAVPLWVKAACATAIALGTFIGGWRIIRTLGKGLVEIDSPQGMAAESASAATIIISSHLGFALSTTHVATGSILGTGLGRKGATVRWGVALRMIVAWLITLPSAALVGAVTWFIGHLIGGIAGAAVVLAILVVFSTYIFWRSRKNPVGHHNVNDQWEATPEEARTPSVKENAR